MNKGLNNKKYAYTLAEIIIVISILGLIAVLTLSRFIPDYQERIRIVKLKSTYSYLVNSYENLQVLEGPITSWGMTEKSTTVQNKETGYSNVSHRSKDTEMINEIFYSGIKNAKIKDIRKKDYYLGMKDKSKAEIDNKNYIFNDGLVTYRTLKNGTIAGGIWILSENCKWSNGKHNNICGDFTIDVNGTKGPNTLGIDIFDFYITSDDIVPTGEKGEKKRDLTNYCNKNINNRQFNGYGCTAWALQKGNQDYLRKNVKW